MDVTGVFLLSFCTVTHFVVPPVFAACKQNLQMKLHADQPSVRVAVNDDADLKCCYSPLSPINVLHSTWVIYFMRDNNLTDPEPVYPSPRLTMVQITDSHGLVCHKLTLTKAQLKDTGFYRCLFRYNGSCLYSHGTYLQAYNPLRRTLDISERWKNSIITIEGVLLLFSVLIPGICQLGKTKRFTQLNRKKQKEEENIYEGLNLDDCNSTYHQIQRSNRHGPYQDVANTAEDDIQFEKP